MRIDFANIPEVNGQHLVLPDAPFLSYHPNFSKIKHYQKEFGGYANIILVGHGGSVNSAKAIIGSLGSGGKNIEFLSTVDPDYIAHLKSEYSKADTLIIAISKSGKTVTQLEALLHFSDYKWLVITEKDTPLEQMAAQKKSEIVRHPHIGGRYVGITEVAFVPAALCGIDVEAIYKGAQQMYEQYAQDNIALQAAHIFYQLEQNGFVDVFMPFYSSELFAFSDLAVQLCHESFGKDGKGQTYLAAQAPESQHHTNQRFLGGRKNIAGLFMQTDAFNTDADTKVPPSMQGIEINDSHMFALNNIPLSYAMEAEFKGTWEDAKIHAIPIVGLAVKSIQPAEIGKFMAFWQMFAVYSSVLRKVNPFDQPEVENSKAISWARRKDFKR